MSQEDEVFVAPSKPLAPPLPAEQPSRISTFILGWLETLVFGANLAQWMSGVSAVVGLWFILFSPASQVLIQYLQSELAIRNSQIANLDAQADVLKRSIKEREDTLNSLTFRVIEITDQARKLEDQRAILLAQVSAAETEKSGLETQIAQVRADLDNSSFYLARERLAATLNFSFQLFGPHTRINLELDKPAFKPRKHSLWAKFLETVDSAISVLPKEEQALGQEVKTQFTRQCDRLSSATIDLPAIPKPTQEPIATFGSRLGDALTRKSRVVERVIDAESDLIECFKTVKKAE